MGSYEDWTQARFGDVAGELAQAVADGLHEAHRRALSAHLASELTTNDAYGAALHVAQHEQLVAATAGLPGVTARKPNGLVSRFPYVVVEERSVVLVPWRFTNTRATRRLDARMRTPVSDLRKVLLGLSAGPAASTQLALEQSVLDSDELEAQLAEEQELWEQLSSFGRVVTVAFGSNPTDGLFEIGWGDAELIDHDSGRVHWHHWQPLPAAQPGQGGLGVPAPAPIRPVDPNAAAVRRFDSAPLDDDLGLAPRTTPTTAPVSEPQPTVPRAGDEDGQA